MPDSADFKFNQMEDNDCRFEEAKDSWDNKDSEGKVIFIQEHFGDEAISDLIEDDSSLMERVYAEIVTNGLNT